MKLILFLVALLGCAVAPPTLQAAVNKPQIETSNVLCVVDVTGLPVPVHFEKSITLTHALKQAAIRREDIKNRVLVPGRLQTNTIQPIKVDLKQVDQDASDLKMDQHDIVYVEAKKKQSPADLAAIGRMLNMRT